MSRKSLEFLGVWGLQEFWSLACRGFGVQVSGVEVKPKIEAPNHVRGHSAAALAKTGATSSSTQGGCFGTLRQALGFGASKSRVNLG